MSRYFENGGLIGSAAVNPYNGGSGLWSASGLDLSVKTYVPQRETSIVSGLTHWYVASDFNTVTQQWPSHNSYGTTLSTGRGTIVKADTSGSGATNVFSMISGNTSTGITIGAMASSYTLFHVTRYTGGGGRIMDGSGNNWLSGTWGGATGIAYHGGWLTNQSSVHGSNWFISTDQNNLYRSNGVQRGTMSGGTTTTLTINNGNYATSEPSSWEVAEVMIYNRTLSSAEYQAVEQELSDWYGIAI